MKGDDKVATTEPAAPPPNTASLATTATPSAATPSIAAASGPGVEVASVNWGEKPGAVYYVPGDDDGATTTVVWLAAQ